MRSERTTASPRFRRDPKKARKHWVSEVPPPVSPASRNRNARYTWLRPRRGGIHAPIRGPYHAIEIRSWFIRAMYDRAPAILRA